MKLKFINLNLWLGGEIFEPMLNFLKEENADILALQEVHNGQANDLPKQLRSFSVLKESLNYKHGYFTPCFLKDYLGYKTNQGNAIFSHFPIKKNEAWFYNAPQGGEFREGDLKSYPILPRALQHVEIEIGGKIINVFNTQGIWDKDGADNPRRLKMGNLIVSKIKDKDNVILAGDFNTWPDTKSMKKIENYLKNVFRDGQKTSFNMKRKTNPGYAAAVVDMVFVSPNIKVLDHKCPNVDVSDHLPLVCAFEV
jgi:endonuclease/exonuclease/phosphatase family metal-dependent hydrolase